MVHMLRRFEQPDAIGSLGSHQHLGLKTFFSVCWFMPQLTIFVSARATIPLYPQCFIASYCIALILIRNSSMTRSPK
ncbi:uncharacterized protein BO66DRAFT_11692 [Aspergillus aculeatinus CBS 121060]|uniref:Uncharacterized protein n=1 Tax=Aspergillus aculeatinus CBS 121060 TaxID=1448322 RepID=A0ACD1HPG8_9EURO|nr:hypothetical protein BO66DRAFT_11692 [Aspergillus aculeatinus CBS 121060]RAH75592.1 hypothetical protein BO66DRAFT_11692 [Aspergillus aculeatinus CBS 121060]